MQSAGYEVILASDGEQALDLYESEQPDLAILDYNMPQRTGIEVIQAIRTMEPQGRHLPAVILSASVTLEARDRASKAGADEFIGKPFDAASLIQQIDRLSKRVTRAGSEKTPTPWRAGIASGNKPRESRPRPRLDDLDALFRSSLIDRARLAQLEDIARDVTFLSELIGGFFGDVDAILTNTQHAIATGKYALIPDLMHSLKGAAVGVGATKLAALATGLDESALEMSCQQIEGKLDEVRMCFQATSTLLRQYLQAHHDA